MPQNYASSADMALSRSETLYPTLSLDGMWKTCSWAADEEARGAKSPHHKISEEKHDDCPMFAAIANYSTFVQEGVRVCVSYCLTEH